MVTPAFVVCRFLPAAAGAPGGGRRSGPSGSGIYLAVVTTPRYFETLVSTIVLSAGVTLATLAIAGVTGVFLKRNHFPGKSRWSPC